MNKDNKPSVNTPPADVKPVGETEQPTTSRKPPEKVEPFDLPDDWR